jgi:hypothetical protein
VAGIAVMATARGAGRTIQVCPKDSALRQADRNVGTAEDCVKWFTQERNMLCDKRAASNRRYRNAEA